MTTGYPDRAALSRDWARGYQSQPHEFEQELTPSTGSIPPELHGRYYRNGPGLLEAGGQPVHHPFDGDGMLSLVQFRDGRAFSRNRFVETAGLLAERRAGRPLYRGVFGTQLPGGALANAFNMQLKNIANTAVLAWGGQLHALWEAGLPHRLDPLSLATHGPDRLGGMLRDRQPFAAHYHIDPHGEDGRPLLVNFGVEVGLNTRITIWEIAADWRVLREHSYELDGFAFLHDMAITPNWIVFVKNPIRYDVMPYLFGLQSAAQGLQSQADSPSTVILIPRRPGSGRVRSFRAPNGFVWHHANAFEDGDQLIIDSVWYERYAGIEPGVDFRQIDVTGYPPGQLARTTIDLRSGRLERRVIAERCCEFPVLHPEHVGRPYRYTYLAAADIAAGNGPLQAIWKVDLHQGTTQIWSAAPRGFVSEPIFVPRAAATAEDDGWLLAHVYDAARHMTDIVILDARDPAAGPLCVLPLGHHLPHGLHGCWAAD